VAWVQVLAGMGTGMAKNTHGLPVHFTTYGSNDGPIVKRLSDHTYNATEGPYYTFNSNWEQVFQCAEDHKKYLVVRGKYGLNLMQAYITHFLKVSGIEANNGLHLRLNEWRH
jgi:hypothetical protein